MTERARKVVSTSAVSTWSLAVEDFGSEEAAPRLLCDVSVVQLAQTPDGRQEQVPQARFPGFHLHAQINIHVWLFIVSLNYLLLYL